MNNVNTQIDLLIVVLNKKDGFLQELLSLTKEQSDYVDKNELDRFNELIITKEQLIEKIIQLDDGFQAIYDRIKGIIEGQPDLYREKIQSMKQIILRIGDLGVAITVQETRNRNQMELSGQANRYRQNEGRHTNKIAANFYAHNNKQKPSGLSSSFDTKK